MVLSFDDGELSGVVERREMVWRGSERKWGVVTFRQALPLHLTAR